MTSERFDALDSVRGIAALTVVVNHCFNLFPWFGGSGTGPVTPGPGPVLSAVLRSPLSLLWHGQGAVSLFFVLSGFVLALPWSRGQPMGYGAFVIRRICRIYLPYAVAVALAMALASAMAPLRPASVTLWFDTQNWSEPVSWSAILNHLLMLGGHNVFDNAVWSLNHEMRISLIFPLLLWPILRFGTGGGVVLAVALYAAAWVINHWVGWRGPVAELPATIRFAAFFVLGAILARHAARLSAGLGSWTEPAAWGALAAGLLLLWAAREPAGMAVGSALVLLSAILPGGVRAALIRPWPRALGRVSYSLYLTHLLIILSAVHLFHGVMPLSAIAVLSLVLALAFSWLFHRWVEAPSNQLGRRLAGMARREECSE